MELKKNYKRISRIVFKYILKTQNQQISIQVVYSYKKI